MPNIARSAVAVVASVPCFALAAPPRYAWHTIEPLGAPADGVIPVRILGFDQFGRGYGFSFTGSPDAPIAAVRWDGGTLAPLPTPAGVTDSHAAAAFGTSVVGWYRTTDGASTGVVWSGDSVTQLGRILPVAANAEGVIAGVIQNPADPRRYAPALWQGGEVTPLEMTIPNAHGWVVGISDRGEVAGSIFVHGGAGQAVRWVDGSVDVLPTPRDATGSEARGMNAAGTIVGAVNLGDHTIPALWRGGELVTLAALDSANFGAWADSINIHDQVVGVAQTAGGRTAFLWDDGVTYDLRELIDGGPTDLDASHLVIADTGHIAGVRYLADGTAQAFVLAPIPAPAAGALTVAGAALAVRRRR